MSELLSIEGEDIVIRLTPGALKFMTENGVLSTFLVSANRFRDVKVTDMKKWRSEVFYALARERENGDTPVYLMLDACLKHAVEQGADGISIEEVI